MGFGDFLSGLPIVGSIFDDSQQNAMDELKKNQDLYGGISLPDLQKYNPDSYQVAGTYDPTLAQSNTINEDPSVRSSQLSSLSKLSGLADTGLSAVDQQGFEQARQMAGQIQNSGTAAALQNATARGMGGSGMEFAMREMANQSGAQNALNAGLGQASQSAQQRALYNQAYGNALSGLRSQDYNTSAANANILNQFNMANTNSQNQAQQYNLGNAQNVANMNTQGKNQAQQYNNNIAEQQYQNQMQKAGGQAGANTAAAGGYAAQNAANQSNRNSNTGLAMSAAGIPSSSGGFLKANKQSDYQEV